MRTGCYTLARLSVSGAQCSAVFSRALEQIMREGDEAEPLQEGAMCKPDGFV